VPTIFLDAPNGGHASLCPPYKSLHNIVMPGLVPGIHVFASSNKEGVDGRDKPGHDDVDIT
jgi:hypothetical protein